MRLEQTIAVDFSQRQATAKVLARSNLFSSHAAGFHLEYHLHSTHETPEHVPYQHVIALQTEGTVQAERRLEGKFRREYIIAGDSCLVPAHTRHWIYSQGDQGLLFVCIEPTFLQQLAYDKIDPDRIELIPHFAKSDPLIAQLGRSLLKALQSDPLGSRFYAESLSTALCAHLIQYYSSHRHSITTDTKTYSNASVQQALDYIQAHLTGDLSLKAIAATIGMSQYHFCRVFKQTTGSTPWQYVIEQRIEAAKRLLAMPQLSIVQISQQLGYSTQGQFANFFRQHTGVCPTEYRKQL